MLLRHLFEAKVPDADAAFAFGRFNPAHQGHIEVYKAVQAAGRQWFIGTNPNTHGPNDPLTFEEKAAWMQAIYPPIKGHILPEQSVVTLASKLYEMLGDGKSIAYVTDSNDWAWAGKLLNDYNGKEGPHGYYKFVEIRHVESPRVSSATALRNAARANDEQAFYAASGTDPNLTVNGKTYFDTVVAATTANPEKPKKVAKKKEPVAAEEKNPHTSALGKALYRDLSKEKKASPAQVQRNKERWAKRQAERGTDFNHKPDDWSQDFERRMKNESSSLNETPTIDFIRGLISEFNKQMSGSPYYPMDYKNPGMRTWTRGDGSKYKDPGYIFIERDLKPEDVPKWKKAGAVEKFWKFLESKGARKIGDVSGEFGSDPHSPAVVLNRLIFVFNGVSITWGSTSRLKNSNVWRQKQQGVAEGLGKDLKRLATGKDAKSRAGQEIAKSQDASMKGDNKTAHKHFKRYDKLDKLANKEQGVAEADSKAMAHTAKSLENPPKVMQHRAKRDQEREQQLKYRDIAKRNESVDLKTSLQELSNDMLGKYKKAASADASKADKEGNFKRGDKRFSGIVKATKKQFDNDAKGKK